MTQPAADLPVGFHLTLEPDAPVGFRAELGQLINAFHAQSVPFQSHRFALRIGDAEGQLAGGLSGVMAWSWLFIEALWVHPHWRGKRLGRVLMDQAERHALSSGCHSAWLDSFQAEAYYRSLGYQVFATLENYPGDQRRVFLRKQLTL